MSHKRLDLITESRPLNSLVAYTHRFQSDRPKLNENNTLRSMIEYLIDEVEELSGELLANIGVSNWLEWQVHFHDLNHSASKNNLDSEQLTALRGVTGEWGDVVHFFNDIMVGSSYSPSPSTWVNGKTPVTIRDYRQRAGELIAEMSDAVPQELIIIQDIEDYLEEFANLFRNILKALEMVGPEEDLTPIHLLMDTALIAIFDLTNKLGINLVAAVLFKNKRNQQKYIMKWFEENSNWTYEDARRMARELWPDEKEAALFMAFLETFGPRVFFLEDDPVQNIHH